MIFIILVINLGSSSLRFNLFSANDLSSICKGICENIGSSHSVINYYIRSEKKFLDVNLKNHKEAFSHVKYILNSSVENLDQISAIGHRIVHGGDFFDSPTLVNSETIEKIRSLIPLAPIHNAANLEGILDCQIEFPGIKQYAVFDTSFFYDLPEKSKIYPIPLEISEKYKIKKYGFHGISHKWAYDQYLSLSKKKECKSISCHLGNGSSICAIKNGIPIDTSMGLTPLGGLMMGTRSGSIDPSIVIHLINSGMTPNEISDILNKQSGLLGVSGYSNDIRKLIDKNDYRCKLALEMFTYRIIKFIGSYISALEGIDSLIFTGGIGQNNSKIRKTISEKFKFLGLEIDDQLNSNITNCSQIISSKNSKIDVCVVKSNEEKAIAEQVKKLIQVNYLTAVTEMKQQPNRNVPYNKTKLPIVVENIDIEKNETPNTGIQTNTF